MTSLLIVLPPGLMICLASSSVSFLTSVAGRLKKPQPCVALKLSTALSESTVGPGSPTIRPNSVSSATFSALQSLKPGTSNAFVLLSTMRLRSALRSPTAGGRTVLARVFFDRRSVRPPRAGLTWTPFRAAGECGFFASGALVLKVEVCMVSRNAGCAVDGSNMVDRPIRQRQHVLAAIGGLSMSFATTDNRAPGYTISTTTTVSH